jgi:hypothetical protein
MARPLRRVNPLCVITALRSVRQRNWGSILGRGKRFPEVFYLLGYDDVYSIGLLATCFKFISCLAYYSTMKMEVVCPSETTVDFRRSTQRYIPEDRNLRAHRCEKLKSYKGFFSVITGSSPSLLSFPCSEYGVSFREQSGRGMKPTAHFHLMPCYTLAVPYEFVTWLLKRVEKI